jgi:hypothetical protein
MMPARNEQIRALAAEILRHARVIALKRRARGLDGPYDQKLDRSRLWECPEEDHAHSSSFRRGTPSCGGSS